MDLVDLWPWAKRYTRRSWSWFSADYLYTFHALLARQNCCKKLMRILHILDHSIPLHSGYTFRTLSILKEQRALGWETFHLTGAKQENYSVPEEDVEGWHFYRTPVPDGLGRNTRPESDCGHRCLTGRLGEVARIVKPDILHAHSPVLNAIPALRVGRSLGIPVVYEVRAFWEDAAVDHGTSREWGIRYRLTRGAGKLCAEAGRMR